MPTLTVEDERVARREPRSAEARPAEDAPPGPRGVTMRERFLAGMCATLMVLGVAAAITRDSDSAAQEARQVAAGPGDQLPPEDTTTTTMAGEPATGSALGAPQGGGPAPLPPLGPPPSRPRGPSMVATALGGSVDIFGSPGAGQRTRQMESPQPSGARLVMLVREQQGEWLKVLLPIRPNGSSGWIKRSEVSTFETDYYIVIGLSEHRITAFSGSAVILDERIGLGAGGTPTPTGLFYIKELLQPPSPGGPYGPYAYGLSAFSEVLFSFGGGPGTVGVHGTNDPSSLGRNVSNGCIRMSNSGVTRLAKLLPLGVPVQISA